MSHLTSAQIDQVLATLMERYSGIWKEIPVTKAQFKNWLEDVVDDQMDTTETNIFNATPAGPAKDWLQANPEVGRDVMVVVEEKRREVL